MAELTRHVDQLDPKRRKLFELLLAQRRAEQSLTQGDAIPSGDRSQPLPLSFTQQRMWLLAQLAPESRAYNLPSAVQIKGRLVPSILERCLKEVVRRHEVLRTRFTEIEGQPRQIVEADLHLRMPVVDLGEVAVNFPMDLVQRLSRVDNLRGYDLSRLPLLRVTLLRWREHDHVLLLNIHHVICDGLSIDLLVGEVASLYEHLTCGTPARLPILPLQYGDFALWQRHQFEEGTLERHLAYWRGVLSGKLPVLKLPTDLPRPPEPSFRGARHYLSVHPSLLVGLKALAQKEKVTLFVTLLAAYCALLQRMSDEQDLLVGTPVSGRDRMELRDLIGLFIDTVVLRCDLAGSPVVREVLQRLHRTVVGAIGHQEVGFENLVREFEQDRDLGRNPLFQVIFSLQAAPTQPMARAGLELIPLEIDSGAAGFELELVLWEREQGMQGYLEYSTDLFEAATVARMSGHLVALLRTLVNQPARRLMELPLLSEVETRQLLVEWNDTAADLLPDLCVHRLVEKQAEKRPEALAVLCGTHGLTYGELDRQANRLAWYLTRQGVGPEHRVGVVLERSLDLVVGLLAVLKAGGAFVPLDPAQPRTRLLLCLEDAAVRVLLTHSSWLGAGCAEADLPQCPLVQVDAERAAISTCSEGGRPGEATSGQLAYVIYTSGSTGRPKGVEVEHRALGNLVSWHWQAFAVSPLERATFAAGLAFDASIWELWPYLAAGAAVYLPEESARLSPATMQNFLLEREITLSFQPTPLAELLLGLEWPQRPALRALLTGGDRLLRRPSPDLPFALVNNYGPTENTVVTTSGKVDPEGRAAGVPDIGRPVANVQVYLQGRCPDLVPQGVPGELVIGGNSQARGYFGRPDLTAERFVPDPFSGRAGARLYRSGDLARWRTDGRLEFLGRNDDQVKVRGFRIELAEVEAALEQDPTVLHAAVAVRELDGERRLIAWVVPRPERTLDPARLRDGLQQRLPAPMIPASFVHLAALPLTPNGKVDRSALPAPHVDGTVARAGAPRGPVEETLMGIWAEVLSPSRPIGVHDDFFAAGGHSLMAGRIISRIRAVFGVDLPLRAIFERPTVAGLAALVQEALRGSSSGIETPPLVRVSRKGELALSFAQERLWFLEQLMPGVSAYNIPGAIRMEGRLDKRALQKSLEEILRRHEALRTTFQTVMGRPLQVIGPPPVVVIPTVDLRTLPPAVRQGLALGIVNAEARRSFNLACGPLLRTVLVQVDDESWLLALILHHIVFDIWSRELFINELGVLYTAFANGKPSPLPELVIQYADFTAWQREWLRGEVLAKQIDYWRGQLGDGYTPAELPTDRPRDSSTQTFRGAREILVLPADLNGEVNALSQRHGTTPFLTLLSAYQVLLRRYTNSDDVAVGTPIDNRNRVELEPLMGFLTNLLVLRTSLAGEPPFRELLGRVREVALGAYTHQYVAFEQLVGVLRPERNRNRQPLFQVTFSRIENYVPQALRLPGLTLTLEPRIHNGGSQFELCLTAFENERRLHLLLDYDVDLYDTATAARMLRHYRNLLAKAVAEPNERVARIDLWTDAERHQMLREWSEGPGEEPRGPCVQDLIATTAATRPDALALCRGSAHMSYGELDRRANQLARYLRRAGVGPDVRVAVCLERSSERVIALLAVLRAGGVYLPLDPHHPRQRLAFVLEEARARILLGERHLLDAVAPENGSAAGIRRIHIDEEGETIACEATDAPGSEVTPGNLAYVIYTSGSTGTPKAVGIEHRALSFLVSWHLETFGIGPDDRATLSAGLAFDASVWELWPYLTIGASVYLPDDETRPSPVRLRDWLAAEGITITFQPTPMAEALLTLSWPERIGLRILLTGGDRLLRHPPPTLPFALINNYGPTENTVVTTSGLVPPSGNSAAPPSIGRPVRHSTVVLLGPDDMPVPIGVPGELAIGGFTLARGYLGRPDLTAERFIPDSFSPLPGTRRYRSGDLARHLPDGRIEFLGRNDGQVKVHGIRIELGEIEFALCQNPGIADAAVITAAGGRGRNDRLVAYIVPAAGSAPVTAELRKQLQQRLPDYMVPATFVFLESLPLTPNGKIDRRALPPPEVDGLIAEAPYVGPANPLEQQLAEIWAEVLGVERVGVHDNFFHMGGHSLLATQLLSQVRERLDVDLPLSTFFEGPTVAGLAESLEVARWAADVIRRPEAPAPVEYEGGEL